MKTYKVDLDYESYLFDPLYREDSPQSLKIIREFEYIFFLVNQENAILKNTKEYSKKYLSTLKNMGFCLPELDKGANQFEYWWGQRKQREVEQKLNSKLTSSQLANQNHWGFQEGIITDNILELKEHLKQYGHQSRWIIKRPNGFSGIGHFQFSLNEFNESVISKILQEKVLLEPVYRRVFDVGTTFIIENNKVKRHFIVENFNSPEGAFRGGAGSSDVNKFKKYIEKKYSYSLDELEEITQQVLNCYIELGASSNIQIDSFVYEENGKLKLYPLVEVNYRKTMGLVIDALARKYDVSSIVEWKLFLKNKTREEFDFQLSPDDSRFISGVKLYR
jgi:hypothetical protein